MAYYRKHHGKLNECGYAMFARLEDAGMAGERLSHFGGELYTLDPSRGVYEHIDMLLKAIIKAIKEDYAQDALSDDLRYLFAENFSGDANAFAAAFAPEDIINSADAYDNWDMVVWMWERILEPAGIDGVITSDGAISFNPEHISEIFNS